MPPGDMSQSNDRGEFTGFVHGGWGWNDVKHNLKGHDRVEGGGHMVREEEDTKDQKGYGQETLTRYRRHYYQDVKHSTSRALDALVRKT